MIEVLIIVYSMIMWIVFKIFKVPVNKWISYEPKRA